MGREIKFRGLQKGNNVDGTPRQWIYGYLSRNKKRDWTESAEEDGYLYYIKHSDFVSTQIDLNTLGQYTGLKDKSGKEIYEGDIVNCDKYYDGQKEPSRWQIVVEDITCLPKELFFGSYRGEREVVGNIYENPNLLSHTNEK